LFFVSPQKNYRDYFIVRGPDDTARPAEGIGGDCFVLYMERFIKHTRIMKDKPLSLVLKNQKPHLDKNVTDLAKENALVILFLPHTSLKLQPLDRSVYGTCRKFVNSSSDTWTKSIPGKTRIIYDIPLIVSQ
jgi:hypothetical protein